MAATPDVPQMADVIVLHPEPPTTDDLARATRTVLAVAAAVARYALDVRARASSARFHRLRAAPYRLVQATAGRGVRALWTAGDVVSGVVGGMADVLLPTVAREALSRLDVTGLVLEFVDIDRLAAALDVDAVVATVDFDAVIDRIDIDAIAAGLDLDTLVDKVDIARVLDRVDLDAVVDRVDIDRVLGRVDLDDVVARVDLDRAVDRVDLDRVIARADVLALVRWIVDEIDLPAVIRSASTSVTSEMVRGVREQSTDADRAVERVVDRLLRRRTGDRA